MKEALSISEPKTRDQCKLLCGAAKHQRFARQPNLIILLVTEPDEMSPFLVGWNVKAI